jgi:hypothetical protein
VKVVSFSMPLQDVAKLSRQVREECQTHELALKASRAEYEVTGLAAAASVWLWQKIETIPLWLPCSQASQQELKETRKEVEQLHVQLALKDKAIRDAKLASQKQQHKSQVRV